MFLLREPTVGWRRPRSGFFRSLKHAFLLRASLLSRGIKNWNGGYKDFTDVVSSVHNALVYTERVIHRGRLSFPLSAILCSGFFYHFIFVRSCYKCFNPVSSLHLPFLKTGWSIEMHSEKWKRFLHDARVIYSKWRFLSLSKFYTNKNGVDVIIMTNSDFPERITLCYSRSLHLYYFVVSEA